MSSILHKFKGTPWKYQYTLGKVLQIVIFKGLGNRTTWFSQRHKKILEENLENEGDSSNFIPFIKDNSKKVVKELNKSKWK